MLMYNLIEYSNDYEKASGGLQQYCKDDPNDNMIGSELFKLKSRLTNNTSNVRNANVETTLPLEDF